MSSRRKHRKTSSYNNPKQDEKQEEVKKEPTEEVIQNKEESEDTQIEDENLQEDITQIQPSEGDTMGTPCITLNDFWSRIIGGGINMDQQTPAVPQAAAQAQPQLTPQQIAAIQAQYQQQVAAAAAQAAAPVNPQTQVLVQNPQVDAQKQSLAASALSATMPTAPTAPVMTKQEADARATTLANNLSKLTPEEQAMYAVLLAKANGNANVNQNAVNTAKEDYKMDQQNQQQQAQQQENKSLFELPELNVKNVAIGAAAGYGVYSAYKTIFGSNDAANEVASAGSDLISELF